MLCKYTKWSIALHNNLQASKLLDRKLEVFYLCVALAVGLFSQTVFGEATKPNILVLIADDQRADTIAALGNPDIETPTLDAIAHRGFHMKSVYCLGSNSGAVCQPSRNMMLAGKTYFRWTPAGTSAATFAPADDSTLPSVFKAAGYETYHHGKRGNTAKLIHEQFDHSHYLDDFAVRWSMQSGKQVCDDAIDFLSQRKSKKPWLMWLEFAMPHDPRAASHDALAKYENKTLTLPKNVSDAHPFDSGAVLVRDEWTALWPRDQQTLLDQWRDYYACITTLDQNIGRLVEQLRVDGSLDNTIIVFTSDHGLGMGSHGLMGKQNLYEAGYKAPCIVAGPKVLNGTSNDPVYLMDIYPTLCELAGITIPAGLDAVSFAATLTKSAPGPRDVVLTSYQRSQRAIRHGEWKLILYPEVSRRQLFNLKNDPDELNDLSNEPSQQERIAELELKLLDAQKEQGDTLKIHEQVKRPDTFTPPEVKLTEFHESAVQESTIETAGLQKIQALNMTTSSNGLKHFEVILSNDEIFAGFAIGYARHAGPRVTGLRFDIMRSGHGDGTRRTVVVGDRQSRWAPLLDGLSAKNQPVGLYGWHEDGLGAVGFIMPSKNRTPYFNSTHQKVSFDSTENGTKTFESQDIRGYYGALRIVDGQTSFESLGLLKRLSE